MSRGEFRYREPRDEFDKRPHQSGNRLVRVTVTVQDAERTWPAAYDAFFELESSIEVLYDIPGVYRSVRGKEERSIQKLVKAALREAAR